MSSESDSSSKYVKRLPAGLLRKWFSMSAHQGQRSSSILYAPVQEVMQAAALNELFEHARVRR